MTTTFDVGSGNDVPNAIVNGNCFEMANKYHSTESGYSDDDDLQPGTSGGGSHVYATRSCLGGPGYITPYCDDSEYSDEDELDRFMSTMLSSAVRKEEVRQSKHAKPDIHAAYARTLLETKAVRKQRADVANEIDNIKQQMAQLEVNNTVTPNNKPKRVSQSFTKTTTTSTNKTTKGNDDRLKCGNKNSKCKIKSSKVKSDVVVSMIRAENKASRDIGDMNDLQLGKGKPVLPGIGERHPQW